MNQRLRHEITSRFVEQIEPYLRQKTLSIQAFQPDSDLFQPHKAFPPETSICRFNSNAI
jgi:hypothetical protein